MKRLMISILFFSASTLSFADSNVAFQQYHSGHYSDAKQELESLANKKNPEALFYLAHMYLYGYAIQKNEAEGLALMTRSAELNYLPAQLYLGKYYLNKNHNLENAFIWFKKAAEKGNTHAQMYTAIAYLNGLGTKKSTEAARKYIIEAAKGGVPMAQFELAKIFLKSKHPGNQRMGRIWLQKSIQNHYPDAIKYAQNTNTPNENVSTTDNTSTTPLQLMMNELKKANISLDFPEIISAKEGLTLTPKLTTLKKSTIIETNYKMINPKKIPIQNILSTITKTHYEKDKAKLEILHYRFDMPPGANTYEEAYKLLVRQAEYGYVPALFQLGQMYGKGLYVKQNDKTALELFLKAAKENNIKAQYMAGLYYFEGKGVEKNEKIATSLFEAAALRGSALAQFLLGYSYEYGVPSSNPENSIKKDLVRASAMYNLAAQNGIPQVQYQLAQLYASGALNKTNNLLIQKEDLAHAYQLYKEATKGGVKDAEIGLAYFYANKNQSEANQKRAFDIADKLADKQRNSAKLLLAILYDRGIGTGKSEGRALKIYKSLAEHNNSIAEFMLGTYYYLDDKNNTAAKEYLERAAKNGSVHALYNLAILTLNDSKNSENEHFISLLTQAANRHYDRASILLADYYLMNNNSPNSVKKASEIYHELAKKQNSMAELKLGYMYEQGISFKQNYNQAIEWYKKSAENNNPIAQYLLGNMYQTGRGVTQDMELANSYYQKSAAHNYTPAITAIGYIYEMYKHDYKKAFEWYTKAATLGNPEAKYNLDLMYQYGKGVPIKKKGVLNWLH